MRSLLYMSMKHVAVTSVTIVVVAVFFVIIIIVVVVVKRFITGLKVQSLL